MSADIRLHCDGCNDGYINVDASNLDAALDQIRLAGWYRFDGNDTCPECRKRLEPKVGFAEQVKDNA